MRMPSYSALTCSPGHSTFMHACTMYLCTLHAATALNSALFVSSKACGVCNGYVRESLTAMKPKIGCAFEIVETVANTAYFVSRAVLVPSCHALMSPGSAILSNVQELPPRDWKSQFNRPPSATKTEHATCCKHCVWAPHSVVLLPVCWSSVTCLELPSRCR